MKKLLTILLTFVICLSAAGCDSDAFKYVNSYKAVGMIRSNTNDSAKLSFMSLDGRIVFKLKYDEASEGHIFYEASIEEGEINVYYDIFDTKEHLFRAQAGYPIEGEGGYIEGGKSVYVIVEADNAKEGSVEIRLGR